MSRHDVQAPQSTVPRQPSGNAPHDLPKAAQVFGVQLPPQPVHEPALTKLVAAVQ